MPDIADDEVYGPIDVLLLEFDPAKNNGEAAAAMLDLIERGIVRLYDLLVIRKDLDGTVSGLHVSDFEGGDFGGFAPLVGARSGLLGDEDVQEAANAMEPGKAAALIVYENTWAVPFVAAALRADAQVIASLRIPIDQVAAALDELEAAESAG